MHNKKKTLSAVGYIRVSSEEQVEGESLGFQQREIKEHCKNKGWELLKIYADKGVSGSTVEKREEFGKMLNDARSRKFDTLVVWKADRFTRDIETGVASLYALLKCGIKIESVRDGFSSDGDEMMNLLQIGIAAKYRKDLISGCVAGQKQKLDGGDPRAFKAKPIAREWDADNKIFKLIPEIAEEWRWVVRSYLSGKGTTTISEEVIKRGNKITRSPSRLLVHLKKNLGDKWTVRYKDGDEFLFNCERIVNEETEKLVLKRIEERKRTPHRNPHRYLLSGKIFCANCHKQLQTRPNQKTGSCSRRYYYVHPPADRTGNDCVRNVRVEYIDRAVVRRCFELFGNKHGFEEALKQDLPNEKENNLLIDRKRTIEKELSTIERNLDDITEKAIAQNLTESLVKRINAKAEAKDSRKAELEKELKQVDAEIADSPSVEDYTKNAERMRKHFKDKFLIGKEAFEGMQGSDNKELIDEVLTGKFKSGRKAGVYVSQKSPRVYKYRIICRFEQKTYYLKEYDSSYVGPETNYNRVPRKKLTESQLTRRRRVRRGISKGFNKRIQDINRQLCLTTNTVVQK